jgi:hypothetical protein
MFFSLNYCCSEVMLLNAAVMPNLPVPGEQSPSPLPFNKLRVALIYLLKKQTKHNGM